MLSQPADYKRIPSSEPEIKLDSILVPPTGADAKYDIEHFRSGIQQLGQRSQLSRSLNHASSGKIVKDYFQQVRSALYPENDVKVEAQIDFLTQMRHNGTVLGSKDNHSVDEKPFIHDSFELHHWVDYFLLESPFDESGQLKSWATKPFPEKYHAILTESMHHLIQWSYTCLYDDKHAFQPWLATFYGEPLFNQACLHINENILTYHLFSAVIQCLNGEYIKQKPSHQIFAAIAGSIIDQQTRVIGQCAEQLYALNNEIMRLDKTDPLFTSLFALYEESKKTFLAYLANPKDAGKIPLLTKFLYFSIAKLNNPNDLHAQAELDKIAAQQSGYQRIVGGVTTLVGVAIIGLSYAGIPATLGMSGGIGYLGGSLLAVSGLTLFSAKRTAKTPTVLNDEKQFSFKTQ